MAYFQDISRFETQTNHAFKNAVCPHCMSNISAQVLIRSTCKKDQEISIEDFTHEIYSFLRCPLCFRCFSIDESRSRQLPGVKPGKDIKGLHEPIKRVYEEVRDCFSVGAYTAATQMCRKILMYTCCHISKDQKQNALPKKQFSYYINFLIKNGHINTAMLPWVEKIKNIGNDANHELDEITEDIALNIFTFTTQLLINIFEMRSLVDEMMNK